MPERVDVKKVKPTSVQPPPLVKGRKGSQIPKELLEALAKMIRAGEWAAIDATFDTKEQAGTAAARFRKALAPVTEGIVLTGRIWGEGKTTSTTGQEIQDAPFHFAIGDKDKVS